VLYRDAFEQWLRQNIKLKQGLPEGSHDTT
jgi:hypothetical protein